MISDPSSEISMPVSDVNNALHLLIVKYSQMGRKAIEDKNWKTFYVYNDIISDLIEFLTQINA